MVHRRTLYDDGLGVWEPLNETAFGQGLVVRGRHQIIVETPNKSAFYHRIAAQQFYMQPFPIYSLTEKTYSEYSSAYRQTWSALSKDLPLNVHLLTLDQLTEKNFLIRLEHYFELNEDKTYSRPVSVDLLSIFQSLGTINYLEELTLAANLPLNNLQRLNWTTNHGEYLQINYSSLEEKSLIDTNIILNPMQIRTFKVTMV
jgi:lysosomal alpha-mannosidase